MANQEHLDILMQGVEVWNQWREKNREIRPDLSRTQLITAQLSGANLSRANLRDTHLILADLHEANLSRANLRDTRLIGANLSRADLRDANLNSADLSRVDLSRANLSDVDLGDANLSGANLNSADLSRVDLSDAYLYFANLNSANLEGANLEGANLEGANLSRANLSRANLNSADLSRANLRNTILDNARIGNTNFALNDLSAIKGLETVDHIGPSTIGTNALVQAKGNIPEAFLRGCGLSDWEIESVKLYNPDLSNEKINDIYYRIHDLRVRRAFQIAPLFISYSHSNTDFVDALENLLTAQGVRFWRDIHHAKAGRLEKQIDQAIHLNNVVLLVLSKDSTDSDWVEHEVRKAREKEKQSGKDALCPVALDDSWKSSRWPARLREQIEEYNILDFANWHDYAHFLKMFNRLLEGLNLFYK